MKSRAVVEVAVRRVRRSRSSVFFIVDYFDWLVGVGVGEDGGEHEAEEVAVGGIGGGFGALGDFCVGPVAMVLACHDEVGVAVNNLGGGGAAPGHHSAADVVAFMDRE